jgi:hypothetical protein
MRHDIHKDLGDEIVDYGNHPCATTKQGQGTSETKLSAYHTLMSANNDWWSQYYQDSKIKILQRANHRWVAWQLMASQKGRSWSSHHLDCDRAT